MKAWTLLALLPAQALCLAAQQAKPQEIAKQEKEIQQTIEANRAGAKPRPVVPRSPLAEWEVQRARIFQEAKGSVVQVTTITKQVNPFTRDERQVESGMGSGFVWDEAGHVVTNYHVVSGAADGEEKLEVTLSGGKRYEARVVGKSMTNDVAVLHVFAPLADLKPLPVGTSSDLVVGQSVLAIGNPFGLDHSLSSGIVSALDREMTTEIGTPIRGVIQTDAAINPGNSGGPLLDTEGRLIGMNTAITSTSGSSAGIGFAIPVDTLNRLVPILIQRSELQRPFLGFESIPPMDAYRQLRLLEGVAVGSVDVGGPAHKAGLRAWELAHGTVLAEGDVIVAIQGQRIRDQFQFLARLEQLDAKDPVEIEVLRSGKTVKLTIHPGAPRKESVIKPKPRT